MEFGEPWQALPDNVTREALEAELRRELPPRHELASEAPRAVAQRLDRDDVLFALSAGRWAIIHLSWRGGPESEPNWPRVELIKSDDNLKARLAADRSEFE